MTNRIIETVSRIRKRIPKSCRRCHRRKQRCVGAPICANCELAGQPCVRSDSVPSWHHGMSKGALAQRIETLEAQLAALTEGNGSEPGDRDRERERERDAVPGLHAGPGSTTRTAHTSTTSISGNNSIIASSPSSPENGGAVMHFLIQGQGYENKVEGNYLGPSSGLAIAENISRIVQDAVWKSIPVNETHEFLAPCENEATGPAAPPDDAMGARLLEAYFKSMQMRLPFLCRAEIYELHAKRHNPLGSSTADQFARFKIFMVYAIGAAILKMTEMYDSTPPRHYFVTAMQYQPSLQESLSINSIEALMLLAMYNLQSSASSSVWYMTGLATRICVDFGLHREAQYRKLRPYEAQRRRRLFWSVYLNDRSVAWSLGRPFSIAEEEIDAEPPADIDDSLTDDRAIEESRRNPKSPHERWQAGQPNIRCFLTCIKLSRITSGTRAKVYRLDREVSTLLHEVGPILAVLDDFQRNIPALSAYEDDFIHMHWHSSTRTLLHPFLSILPPEDELTRKCLHASGQMCQYFKRLRQRDSTWYSFMLINTIFMSGLTMCLLLFRSPALWTMNVSNDLRACSSSLFVMAERHPSVRKYRDALETTINRVMDYVSDAQQHEHHHGGGSARGSISSMSEKPPPYGALHGHGHGLDRSLTDPPTPGFLIPSPQASRGPPGGQTPRTPETPDPRTFSGLFVEDFWAGDAFSLHMGESFGLRA
ncbi:fungal-specific transcription factor domain-containing protein [Aspergillus pseudoustus]|uniref:Fungal-specific transcription factor domain-containing protein n=1 Tax=Aspergillus pseudoustus TaxID=1810923 RepID=A0ABR4JM76_9EURO